MTYIILELAHYSFTIDSAFPDYWLFLHVHVTNALYMSHWEENTQGPTRTQTQNLLSYWAVWSACDSFHVSFLVCSEPYKLFHLSHCMTKPTKWLTHPAKTQISLGIFPVWSETSLSALRNLGSHWAHNEDSDQTGQVPRLIWVLAERTGDFVGFVMRRLISVSTCNMLPSHLTAIVWVCWVF